MIKIETLRYDGVEDFQIRISFNGDLCYSALDIWGQSEMFSDFAQKLVDFPFGKNKTVKFEYGEDDRKLAYYLFINLAVFDPSGKIVMNTIVDNKREDPYHYRCEIPIITDVAAVNELGKHLLRWTPIENQTWCFPVNK